MGEIFAEKLNTASGPVAVLIPLKGFSQLDLEGKPFYWPEASQAFINAIKENLRPDIAVIEMEYDINAPQFSEKAAKALLEMLKD